MSIVKGTKSMQVWQETSCLKCTECSATFPDNDQGSRDASAHMTTHVPRTWHQDFVYLTDDNIVRERNRSPGFMHEGFRHRVEWSGEGWYKFIERDTGYRTDDYFTSVESLIEDCKEEIREQASRMKHLKFQKDALEKLKR